MYFTHRAGSLYSKIIKYSLPAITGTDEEPCGNHLACRRFFLSMFKTLRQVHFFLNSDVRFLLIFSLYLGTNIVFLFLNRLSYAFVINIT